MNFDLLDIICFIGAIQGLFLAIALQTISNKNKTANKTLSIILFTVAFYLLCRVTYYRFENQFFIKIAFSANTVMFILGPLIYTYVRRLTFKEPKEKAYKLPFYHYVPAIVYFLSVMYVFFILQKSFNQVLYKLISIQVIAIPLKIYYLFKAHQLIKFYQKKEKNALSYDQNVTSFLNAFSIAISAVILFWLIALCNAFFELELAINSYKMILLALALLVFVVSYYSLKQPEVFRIKLEKDKKKKSSKKRISESVLIQLQEELNLLMKKEKIYLNNELTLKDLAEKLNTNSNNISWLLNSVYNCTFYEYINHLRVKDFISKIENGAHKKHTVLALSMDSGFKSKSTFNKAFKAEMNDTPTNYIKSLRLN